MSPYEIPGAYVALFTHDRVEYVTVDYYHRGQSGLKIIRPDLIFPEWEDRGLVGVAPSTMRTLHADLAVLHRRRVIVCVTQCQVQAGESMLPGWRIARLRFKMKRINDLPTALRPTISVTDEPVGVGLPIRRVVFLLRVS